jgi:hypothetical protein
MCQLQVGQHAQARVAGLSQQAAPQRDRALLGACRKQHVKSVNNEQQRCQQQQQQRMWVVCASRLRRCMAGRFLVPAQPQVGAAQVSAAL